MIDGDLAPPKVAQASIFGPCLLWSNGCMDQEMPLGMQADLGPDHIVLDGDPAPLRKRGTAPPAPAFRPLSIDFVFVQ